MARFLGYHGRELRMRWRFGRFQLDRESACLWEGEQRLTLRPKTFDLLVYLVEHAGELARKETLLGLTGG